VLTSDKNAVGVFSVGQLHLTSIRSDLE